MGDSGERELQDSGNVNKFEKNQEDVFKVTAVELGRLKKVKIRHDNKGGMAAWYLDRIEVQDPKNNKTYGTLSLSNTAQARFPSKRNRLRCVRCVWMETGLNACACVGKQLIFDRASYWLQALAFSPVSIQTQRKRLRLDGNRASVFSNVFNLTLKHLYSTTLCLLWKNNML